MQEQYEILSGKQGGGLLFVYFERGGSRSERARHAPSRPPCAQPPAPCTQPSAMHPARPPCAQPRAMHPAAVGAPGCTHRAHDSAHHTPGSAHHTPGSAHRTPGSARRAPGCTVCSPVPRCIFILPRAPPALPRAGGSGIRWASCRCAAGTCA